MLTQQQLGFGELDGSGRDAVSSPMVREHVEIATNPTLPDFSGPWNAVGSRGGFELREYALTGLGSGEKVWVIVPHIPGLTLEKAEDVHYAFLGLLALDDYQQTEVRYHEGGILRQIGWAGKGGREHARLRKSVKFWEYFELRYERIGDDGVHVGKLHRREGSVRVMAAAEGPLRAERLSGFPGLSTVRYDQAYVAGLRRNPAVQINIEIRKQIRPRGFARKFYTVAEGLRAQGQESILLLDLFQRCGSRRGGAVYKREAVKAFTPAWEVMCEHQYLVGPPRFESGRKGMEVVFEWDDPVPPPTDDGGLFREFVSCGYSHRRAADRIAENPARALMLMQALRSDGLVDRKRGEQMVEYLERKFDEMRGSAGAVAVSVVEEAVVVASRPLAQDAVGVAEWPRFYNEVLVPSFGRRRESLDVIAKYNFRRRFQNVLNALGYEVAKSEVERIEASARKRVKGAEDPVKSWCAYLAKSLEVAVSLSAGQNGVACRSAGPVNLPVKSGPPDPEAEQRVAVRAGETKGEQLRSWLELLERPEAAVIDARSALSFLEDNGAKFSEAGDLALVATIRGLAETVVNRVGGKRRG